MVSYEQRLLHIDTKIGHDHGLGSQQMSACNIRHSNRTKEHGRRPEHPNIHLIMHVNAGPTNTWARPLLAAAQSSFATTYTAYALKHVQHCYVEASAHKHAP
jgi:hypothetical protein